MGRHLTRREQAYLRFLHTIAKTGKIWTLQGIDGPIIAPSQLLADQGGISVPFWSHSETVNICAQREWMDYSPRHYRIEELCQSLLPALHEDGIYIGIDWDKNFLGVEVSAKRLLLDLGGQVPEEKKDQGTLYLVKDSDELVCDCRCEEAYAALPDSSNNPWEGSGWLFQCIACGGHFTFARAAYFEEKLEKFAKADLENRMKQECSSELVMTWVSYMRTLLSNCKVDERYVFLDGFLVPLSQAGFQGVGVYRPHNWDVLPQIEALENEDILEETLHNPGFWNALHQEERI